MNAVTQLSLFFLDSSSRCTIEPRDEIHHFRPSYFNSSPIDEVYVYRTIDQCWRAFCFKPLANDVSLPATVDCRRCTSQERIDFFIYSGKWIGIILLMFLVVFIADRRSNKRPKQW